MSGKEIKPEKITRPFQLLAAWLVVLVTLDGSFLTAARLITQPDWAPAALVITAIVNIPIFIGILFLLLTKYRKELQDDKYYSKHLEDSQDFRDFTNLLAKHLTGAKISKDVKKRLLAELTSE